MRRRIVKKFQHLWVPFQHLLYDAALHAYPAAMDDPHLMQTGSVSFGQVLFDNRRNIARRERMKVEHSVDGNSKRVSILHVRECRVWRS